MTESKKTNAIEDVQWFQREVASIFGHYQPASLGRVLETMRMLVNCWERNRRCTCGVVDDKLLPPCPVHAGASFLFSNDDRKDIAELRARLEKVEAKLAERVP